MSDSQETALVKVSDLFGVSRPAVRLIEAVERGVGNLLQPWHMERIAKAELSNFERWQSALTKSGLSAQSADLTLQDRAAVRLVAQEIQRQGNRESIALEAAKEFKETIEGINGEGDMPDPLDVEWVDRFWRLAQDVTDADMQTVWGKILARQATAKGRFSPRCLETISLLTHDEITLLERLAKYLWTARADGNATYFILHSPKLEGGKQVPTELSRRIVSELGNLHRETLGPAGIALDSGSGWAQAASVDMTDGKAYITIEISRFELRIPNNKDGLTYIGSCLGISPIGGQIFSLINGSPDATYVALIAEAFRVNDAVLTPA